MRRLLLMFAAARSLMSAGLAMAQTEGAPAATPELVAALGARDAEFFAAFFDRSDPAAVRAMLTDDMEVFHDKGGLVATSADAFVEDFAGHCEWVKTGEDFLSRRELVPGSVTTFVLNP